MTLSQWTRSTYSLCRIPFNSPADQSNSKKKKTIHQPVVQKSWACNTHYSNSADISCNWVILLIKKPTTPSTVHSSCIYVNVYMLVFFWARSVQLKNVKWYLNTAQNIQYSREGIHNDCWITIMNVWMEYRTVGMAFFAGIEVDFNSQY